MTNRTTRKNGRRLSSLLLFTLLTMSYPGQAQAETSIQEQIDQAEPGDTVTVSEDVAEESVTIDKPLTLQGDGVTMRNDAGETLLAVESEDVTIEGIRFVQEDTQIEESIVPGQEYEAVESEPVVSITDSEGFTFTNNEVKMIGSGLYAEASDAFTVTNNEFNGTYSSYVNQGLAAVELYETNQVTITGNDVENALDGFYLDSLQEAVIHENAVTDSRYAVHLMYSSQVEGHSNRFQDNVNGLMIMDSEEAEFFENTLTDQFDVRGYGLLVYRSENIHLHDNEISRNSTGVKLEETENVSIHDNVIAGNQVGLSWERQQADVNFYHNDMVSNVLSTQGAFVEKLSLSHQAKGNYWSDYALIDKNGDGVGEAPYVAGSIYDAMLTDHPEWQLFMHSPSMTLWSQVSEWLPSQTGQEVTDEQPRVDSDFERANEPLTSGTFAGVGGVLLLLSGAGMYYFQRRNSK